MEYKELAVIFDNLAVGATVALLVAYAVWVLPASPAAPSFWRWAQTPFEKQPTVSSIALILLVYGTGHVLMDVSEALYTDDRHPLSLIASKGRMRADAIVTDVQLKSDLLGRRQSLLELAGDLPSQEQRQQVVDAINAGALDLKPDHPLFQKLYYAAKNWCYLQPTYFQELSRTEQWMTLTRAMALVSVVGLMGAVTLFLGCGVLSVLGGLTRTVQPRGGSIPPPRSVTHREPATRIAVAAFICFVIGALVVPGYQAEAKWYTRRVVGYWLSSAPRASGADSVESLVWQKTSGEYVALATQAYNTAIEHLDRAVELKANQPPDVRRRKLAVIMDIDDTAIDTMEYQTRLSMLGSSHSTEAFAAWLKQTPGKPIPGALAFVQAAVSHGVTVFYVTNRAAETEPDTRRNLSQLGFPVAASPDVVLCAGENQWSSDKHARRQEIQNEYDVLLVLGDDLGDFISVIDKSSDERRKDVRAFQAEWGKSWFILPNPVYGSWKTAAFGRSASGTSAAQKIALLGE